MTLRNERSILSSFTPHSYSLFVDFRRTQSQTEARLASVAVLFEREGDAVDVDTEIRSAGPAGPAPPRPAPGRPKGHQAAELSRTHSAATTSHKPGVPPRRAHKRYRCRPSHFSQPPGLQSAG